MSGSVSLKSLASGGQTYGASISSMTDVHLKCEKNAIDSFECTIHHGFRGSTMPFSAIRPLTFKLSYSDGRYRFIGRVHTVQYSSENGGQLKIIAEDTRGYLKDSFIFYGPESNDDIETIEEEEEIPEEERNYSRPIKGREIIKTLNFIKDNHNAFISETGIGGGIQGRLTGFSLEDPTIKFKSNMDLDGMSTFDALDSIFSDIGYEWDLVSYADTISITAAKKIRSSGTGLIKTGVNLNTFVRDIDLSDGYSAIMPFGGYGYNERRLTLSDEDMPNLPAGGSIDEYADENTGSRTCLWAVNQTLVSLSGLRIKPVIYDDIVAGDEEELKEKRDELVKKAKDEAAGLASDYITYDISAYDLSSVGGNNPYIMYGNYTVQDAVTSQTVTGRLTGCDIDLTDPQGSSITIEVDI